MRCRHAAALLAAALLAACSEQAPDQAAGPAAAAAPASPPVSVPAGFQDFPRNPAAADSTSPHLAANGNGVLMSWMEPQPNGDHALRFSVFSAGAWQPARTVTAGPDLLVNPFDFGAVVPAGNGLLGAQWLVTSASGRSYDLWVTLSTDSGDSWRAPMMPHGDGTPTEHGFAALLPLEGELGVVWIDGRDYAMEIDYDDPASWELVIGSGLRSRRLAPDGTASAEQVVDPLVCDCCRTDVAVSGNGPVLVYRDRTEDEIRDHVVRRWVDGGGWSDPVTLGPDNWFIEACPINGPAIAAEGMIVAAAWFTGAGDLPRVRFSRSTDAGRTFEPALDLKAGDTIGRVDVTALANGDAIVSWVAVNGADAGGTLQAQRVYADGRRGGVRDIAGVPSASAIGFPQMLTVDDYVLFAWANAAGADPAIVTRAMPTQVFD